MNCLLIFRRFSTASSKDVAELKNFLTRFTPASIPTDKLTVQYHRSSGPGGQNVNKVNTKAEVRFNVSQASWIPYTVRSTLEELNENRMNKKGEFIIASDRFRTQMANFDDCIQKLHEAIIKAVESKIPPEIDEEKVERIEEL
ncbi:Peptidyl-tRNA hydrolase ict1, mitochondrial [Rhizoclosmatium hyalinum]|nr:Peptidyl-tRNA hydrolase ict1, mitochondrial [Rhizoclosmatium hyalinum]